MSSELQQNTKKKLMMTKAVKWLLISNIAAYIVSLVINLNEICALYFVGTPHFMPFQFITYMFMHGGISHLFFNMFALWMFGRIIEQTWGTKRFLIYYLVCGLGAALIQEIGQMIGLINPDAMTIGASGAIYGILLAFGMLYPNEKIFIMFLFPIKAKYFVMGYAAIEIFEGLNVSDGVAHFAHLGGMLFGLLLILFWRKRAYRPSNHFSGSKWRTTSTRPYTEAPFYNKNEHSRDYEFNAQKKEQNDEIDRILDKVRKDGYANLSESEKRKLFEASGK